MATYYVDNVTGDDGNSGTGTTEAWATISHAASGLSTGDHVYIKGGTDYDETVNVSAYGDSNAYNIWEGYTTTPGDNGKFVIQGSAYTNCLTYSTTSNIRTTFRNMVLKGAQDHGLTMTTAWAQSRMSFENCDFIDNGNYGVSSINNNIAFIGCSFTGNTGDGVRVNEGYFVRCKSQNNGGHGFYCGRGSIEYCISVGDLYAMYNGNGPITNCTIDGVDGTTYYGLQIAPDAVCIGLNNNVYGCDWGVYNNTYNSSYIIPINYVEGNNINDSIVSGYSNILQRYKDLNVDVAPGFTDEVGGDYTLASDSECINAGVDFGGSGSTVGTDIGAYQSQDEGSGPSQIIITG